jgi:hypothetical protein
MSELELAALVTGHHLQLNHTPPQRHTTSVIATDNTPMQAWVHSGSVSTIKPPAFLLHLLAHDCRAWTSQIIPVFAPGTTNTISDFLSRSFAFLMHHLGTKLFFLPVEFLPCVRWQGRLPTHQFSLSNTFDIHSFYPDYPRRLSVCVLPYSLL